jgi:flagellar biosynthesis protein FliP
MTARFGTRIAVLATLIAATAMPAQAQDASGLLSSLAQGLGSPQGETSAMSGRILQMLALMTVLSVAPGLLVVMTSFTRFIIVFSMLRSALGLNQTPPNMVITSLAMFMTFFVMQPVFEDAWNHGLHPLLQDAITEEQAVQRVAEPFKRFMYANAKTKDIELFQHMSLESVAWRELVPAFMISELSRAFQIGFLIYLPFIVIDLVVASVLMSAGMMMLPPVMISLPFKVIIFVLIDGWYKLVGSLVESYVPMVGG